MTRVRLVKLSVCACGYPLLDESIPLGTEYLIDETQPSSAVLNCGGCRQDIHVATVYVYRRGQSHGGQLPVEVFEEI